MNKVRVIKIGIILCLIVLIILINLFGFKFNNSNYDNVVGQRVDGLIFSKVNYMYNPNEGGNLVVNIINSTNDVIIIDGIKLNLRDDNDKIMDTINTKIYLELEANDKVEYVFYTKGNIDNNDYELEYVPNIVKDND